MPSDADARDRTALSWERSALSLGVLAALFLSAADRTWLAIPFALLLGLAAIAVVAYARRRARGAGPVAPAWAAARALTAITFVCVLYATAVVIGQA